MNAVVVQTQRLHNHALGEGGPKLYLVDVIPHAQVILFNSR